MKYLQDYMSDAQSVALDKAGAFFAFSKSQFEEKKIDGIKYANGPAGMICPSDNLKTLLLELSEIHQSAIKQDIAENGLNAIIRRELNNHECYYSGDIEYAADALSVYGLTYDDVLAVYNNQKHTPEVLANL